MNRIGILFAVMAAPITVWAAIPAFQATRECAVQVHDYRQKISLYQEGFQVEVRADEACSLRVSQPLDLKGVRLTIESAQGRIARLESPTGWYSPHYNRVFLSQVQGPTELGQIGLVSSLLLDLNTGELRSPNGVYLVLKREFHRFANSLPKSAALRPHDSESKNP